MNVVIVLPTYNEKDNISRLIDALLVEFQRIEESSGFFARILVVDDNSPDGTGGIVKSISEKKNRIFLLNGTKKGLGNAYIRGFRHAIDALKADVVMEMDADFSHNPKDVIRLLSQIADGADFVIGSRYIPGGAIPKTWALKRKLISFFGNIFARYVAGIYQIHDCTAGFRAIRAPFLEKIGFEQLKADGYSFQMNLLHKAMQNKGKVVEVPVIFVDRKYGESKIRMTDIREFIFNAVELRLSRIKEKRGSIVQFAGNWLRT